MLPRSARRVNQRPHPFGNGEFVVALYGRGRAQNVNLNSALSEQCKGLRGHPQRTEESARKHYDTYAVFQQFRNRTRLNAHPMTGSSCPPIPLMGTAWEEHGIPERMRLPLDEYLSPPLRHYSWTPTLMRHDNSLRARSRLV